MADETPAIIPSERAPASRLDRTLREKLILVAMAGGAMMAIAGGAAAGADVTRGFGPGVLVASLGSLLAFGAMALSYGIPSLERMRTARAYSRHAQLQQWTRLKAVGMTFSVLTGLGVFILATAMMTRIAPNGFEASFALVARLTLLLNGVLAVGLAASHFLSLHPALERPRAEGMAQMGFYLAGTASAGLAVLAAAMAFVPLDIAGFVKLRPIDPPFFLLASTTFGAVALFVSRSIPTLHVLFGDERTYYTGDNYFSRTKSVVMPALMALTMLLLVVLVLMLLGAGLAGLAGDIPQNHFLLGLLGFVAVALLFTGTMALRLAKSEDQVKLYRQGRSLEQRQSLIILGASGAVASVCALLAGLLYFRVSVLGIPQTRWIDFLCFTLLALCGPYGFWMNRKNKRMRSLEARFPDFLRDLAASRKAGLTLTAAVQNAARGEYGALTPEIRTMADQLSWDVPFEEALAGFGKRVRTPLVERSVSLIIEASRSGGNVNDVLMAAANDARELKNLEHERGSTMSIYTMVIYITFAVFLAVVAVLYGTFIPQILSSGQAIAAKGGAGKFGGITVGNLTLEGYRVFYFLAAVVQGMGNGFVAGVIGSGKVMDGMRHAFVLVLIAYLTFSVILGGG